MTNRLLIILLCALFGVSANAQETESAPETAGDATTEKAAPADTAEAPAKPKEKSEKTEAEKKADDKKVEKEEGAREETESQTPVLLGPKTIQSWKKKSN